MKMRAKNSGTFKLNAKGTIGTWTLYGEKLSKSTEQLSEIFRTKVPSSQGGSEPYWKKFLQSYFMAKEIKQGFNSPCQEHIKSLEGFRNEFVSVGKDTTGIDAELSEVRNIPQHSIDYHDMPALHPDQQSAGNALEAFGMLNEVTIRLLNENAPKAIPAKESVFAQIEKFLAQKLKIGRKQYNNARKVLHLFKQFTGDIKLKDICKDHWVNFTNSVKENPSWEDGYKWNFDNICSAFLIEMAADNKEMNIAFLTLTKYRIPKPDGNKLRWSKEDVLTALREATGKVRNILLLGLNCGQTMEDIFTNESEATIGKDTLTRVRWKERKKRNPIEGTWHLWAETRKALETPISKSDWYQWEKFIADHKFKAIDEKGNVTDKTVTHKMLRKTVQQLMDDLYGKDGETRAKLYRADKSLGTHGKFYKVAFSSAQIKLLTTALKRIEKELFPL